MGGRGHATEPVVGQPSFQDRRRHVMPMTRASNLRVTLPMAYLAVGALLVVVHATLETGSLPQSLLYDVIGASAVTVALIGVWRNKPDRAAPWILMAVGQALFVAGDLLWNWYEVIGEDPFPSTADMLYLAGYPFIALGLLMMIRRRVGGVTVAVRSTQPS